MAKSSAEYVREYRERQKAKGAPDSSRAWKHVHKREARERSDANLKPFVGCDGEGALLDDLGRQLYLLFRMGERELFTGERLRTEEILDFICDHPANCILVGFAFGYDVTMILRDLPVSQLNRLVAPKVFDEGISRYVWYKNFDIEYLSKQYFRVRRVNVVRSIDGSERRVPVKGSSRTIFETFGFFQKSFLKSIESFDVGTDAERRSIAANKGRRADFLSIDREERDYCAMECVFLAELMEKLREYCYAANIRPTSWNGAGKLAKALLRQHKTMTVTDVAELVPPEVQDYANMAYYGGRFEITRTGMIKEEVHETDIRSAYPDAMRFLPCLLHGRWEKLDSKRTRENDLYVATCTFKHSDKGAGQLCGLPVRSKEGHLYWPLQGGGVYWSPEIDSARLLGARVSIKEGWIYTKTCQCVPFDWVEPLYDYRQQIGSAGVGYPIKLGINSIYGATAQRKGNGKFANMVWAGLTTAFTRAKLNKAIAQAPGEIVMVATDAVYSLKPLDLDEGVRLGQWDHERLDGLTIVQPGLYWCPAKRKRKSRGLPGKFFEEAGRTESFETAWRNWNGNLDDIPRTDVPLTSFIGLKLALSRNRPETAGRWVADHRSISFDYRNKREGHIWGDGHIITSPKPGRPGLVSLPHRDFLKAGGQEPWEEARAMLEDQPDYVDLGIPFKD